MDGLTVEVRSLLGQVVEVRTAAGTMRGTLLSCTRTSLWLVAGERDVIVPLVTVSRVSRVRVR